MIMFSATCPFCGKVTEIQIDAEGYNRWKSGTLIQTAFPQMSTDDRELLITGICPPCWNSIFGEEDAE